MGHLKTSRLPSSSPSCRTGFRADGPNSSEAQRRREREIAFPAALPGRSWGCHFPGGLQIAVHGTRKMCSLGNGHLVEVNEINELAESSCDLLTKISTGRRQGEFGISVLPLSQEKEHQVFLKSKARTLGPGPYSPCNSVSPSSNRVVMKMKEMVVVTSSGRVQSSWARVGILTPDLSPLCPFFLTSVPCSTWSWKSFPS